jgi:two-component system, NtrC family, response regulator AtoC
MPASAPAALVITLGCPKAAQLKRALEDQGVETESEAEVNAAIGRLDARPFAAAVLNWSDHSTTASAISTVTSRQPDVRVLVVASGTSEAVDAMRAGASDVVDRDAGPQELAAAVRRARVAADEQVEAPSANVGATRLIGTSRPMTQVLELVRRAAASTATVLIRGESGTGKELVARALHAQSSRGEGPFVTVHCAALPDSLLESELFGHEKGAFTGATARRPGRVEVAEGGTLFLDEIGDITPAIQVKLLRLLQEREYERLGSTARRQADVRFVAATHRDLEGMIKTGAFREDLFYRLNVVPLWLPPLRARRDDIEPLAQHYCAVFGHANGKAGITLSPEASRRLRTQRWPGNVRQLQNFVERLVVLADEAEITADAVEAELSHQAPFATQSLSTSGGSTCGPSRGAASDPPSTVGPLGVEMAAAEKRALERALRHARGNRTQAARLLGVSRATLYNKLEEHGLS